MHRLTRLAMLYVALSVVWLPITLLLTAPHWPDSSIGWLATLFLPVPLVVLGEWLLQYRPTKVLRPIDQWASRNSQSPFRLVVVVGLIALAGSAGLLVLSLVG